MKPAPFDYLAPTTVAEAVAMLGAHGANARLLAGGQSLIPGLNFRALSPAVLIDLNTVGGLDYVRVEGGEVRIGAMTRNSTLETDPIVAEWLPLMHATIPLLAHTAIRNRGTIGGSLAYADTAAELPAVSLAYGARFLVRGPRGERWIPADEFFVAAFETALAPDEMLIEAAYPPAPSPGTWGFEEIARRHGDRVMMGVSAVLGVEGGVVREARLAFQNAAPTPFLARGSSAWLAGRRLDDAAIAEVAARVHDEVAPPGEAHASVEYQRHLARELTARALRQARSRLA
jgi:aerobic carbon-monoxide dehydrogenase medium subunit